MTPKPGSEDLNNAWALITDLQARLSAAEAERDSLYARAVTAEKNLAEVQRTGIDLQARLSKAVRLGTKNGLENEKLRETIEELTLSTSKYAMENERLNQRITDLALDKGKLQARLSAAEEERDRAIQSCAALRAGKETLESRLSEAEELRDRLLERIDRVRSTRHGISHCELIKLLYL